VLGKFRLGDFGLAINTLKELAFSRSGTLDYMAPEVRLKKAGSRRQPGPVCTRLPLAGS
jgi:serine/threonine protein kinase